MRRGGKVVVGGHSLGGTMTTAYATWDSGGTSGARGLAGLVFIDGASRTEPVTADAARRSSPTWRRARPG
jgi:pimeloyl-ACP methyl ester carboxylesterase